MSVVKQRKECGFAKLRDLMKSFQYRQIKNRLVGIATIIADGKCRVTDATNLNEFFRSSINRAETAVEKGRTVGKVGRPELFTKEDKEVIAGVIRIENVPVGFSNTPINMPNSTLVVAVAADGYSLPSLVLWPSKKLPQEMKVLLSPQLHIWADNDGWMTDALFARYAEEILLPGIVERRKLLDMNEDRCLLLLDSHPSRAQPDLWQKFADESIDVVTFIPHSTHLTQPLDCGVFDMFKRCFNSNNVVPSSSSISFRRKAVANDLPQALQTALLPSTINSAFEKSGVLSRQSNSVLVKLPDTPSVQLKK
ncbi:putative DDE superfamily endonuclease [Monocercomonoides exilis]|uniref:putative DDE superfamily endonuclease n=1 Tax=Monocercomonoides exilis TaxID=2049356 RepID=UPI00355A7424|nr:putative DDE superfamily endonuclease [Monocercomonoides exilis]|eukprot:MONOS_12709.1-p1 / transcript=MONOS_12709.1 / gene=MONOS_12709 / organism=Monocercomonoides_exilis_PA203 / gene_product=unspecified product / transcript_product=unspecified product / location=Mono_scaffold00722:30047-31374(-) / protein_length=308 / sequence_SO=supercontig / SO=protein_coding / is_pseudo=false